MMMRLLALLLAALALAGCALLPPCQRPCVEEANACQKRSVSPLCWYEPTGLCYAVNASAWMPCLHAEERCVAICRAPTPQSSSDALSAQMAPPPTHPGYVLYPQMVPTPTSKGYLGQNEQAD